MRRLELQDETGNMLEVAQRERERQSSSEMQQRQLVDEVMETSGQQNQEQGMVEHLRGQVALIKGSELELSASAEMNARDVDQKSEIHGYQLKITEKELRAKQFQYEARVTSEATKKLEIAMNNSHRKAKEEQQQLKDANLALRS